MAKRSRVGAKKMRKILDDIKKGKEANERK